MDYIHILVHTIQTNIQFQCDVNITFFVEFYCKILKSELVRLTHFDVHICM